MRILSFIQLKRLSLQRIVSIITYKDISPCLTTLRSPYPNAQDRIRLNSTPHRIHSNFHSDPKVLISPRPYMSEIMQRESKFSHMKSEMNAQFLSRSHEINQMLRI